MSHHKPLNTKPHPRHWKPQNSNLLIAETPRHEITVNFSIQASGNGDQVLIDKVYTANNYLPGQVFRSPRSRTCYFFVKLVFN